MRNMVDLTPPQRRDSHESMEARFSARYSPHTALAMVFMRLTHCYVALHTPEDLTTALCQACGEAPKLGYFGLFEVVLTQLPTATNGRHGVCGRLCHQRARSPELAVVSPIACLGPIETCVIHFSWLPVVEFSLS